MLEGHGRVDLPRVHGHPAAWVGKGRALWLPVVVARGHVASCWATINPVLVAWRVGARRDITGQSGGRLRRKDKMLGVGEIGRIISDYYCEQL